MRRQPRYEDGLDADGYPAESEPYRRPYVHGSEADVGDFKPMGFGSALMKVVERMSVSAPLNETSDSPIETLLGAAVILFFQRANKPLKLCMSADMASGGLTFIPQFKWSFYRSDWALYNPKTTGAMLLECDGKEFHSSDDQKAHDQKKDAAAHDRGYLTMRFTGSQIHRDADGCAQKVWDAVYGGAR